MRLLPSLLSALALASLSLAQSETLPAIFANTEGGTSGNIWRAGLNRVQCIYDSTNWTTQQPIQINSLEWRLAGGGVTNIVTYPQVDIYVQYCATDFLTPDITFANNRTVAFPTTPNYSGPVTTVAVPGTTPNGFFITIPLSTPFIYDPSLGQDLLIEIEISQNPSPVLGNTISTGYDSTGAHLCSSIRSVGSVAALTGSLSWFCPVVRCNYSNLAAASNTTLGLGCNRRYTSFYESFPNTASYDLPPGTAITWLPSSGGYVVDWSGSWLPLGSVSTPTALVIDDDQTLPWVLTTGSFPGWSTLYICANGMIADQNMATNEYYTGLASVNLNRAMTVFYCFGDFDPFLASDPTYPGTGTIYVEENPTVTSITWDAVGNWNHVTSLNTFQWQFYSSGIVTLVIQAIGPIDTSNPGLFIGYSPGGPSYIPPMMDLSAQNPVPFLLDAADEYPLALTANNRPRTIGAPWNLTVSQIPGPLMLGVEVYGLSDPNIADLWFIGMPGCPLRASLDVLNAFVSTGTTHNYSLFIPANPSLNGASLYMQAALLDAAANTAGIKSSNGIRGLMNPM